MTKKEQPIHPQEASTLAVVTLVLGVVSLTGPGLLLGIPAIITGIIALKRNLAGRGLSIAGLVMGVVSTIFSLLAVALFAFFVFWSVSHPDEYDRIQRDLNQPEQQVESSQT